MSNASVLILLRVVTLAKFKGLSAPSQEVLNPLNLHFPPQKHILSRKWMEMVPQPRFNSVDNDLINFFLLMLMFQVYFLRENPQHSPISHGYISLPTWVFPKSLPKVP